MKENFHRNRITPMPVKNAGMYGAQLYNQLLGFVSSPDSRAKTVPDSFKVIYHPLDKCPICGIGKYIGRQEGRDYYHPCGHNIASVDVPEVVQCPAQ